MAVNSPFTKFIAEAASGDLTRALVKEGEQGSETLEGWLRILVVDTGGQLAQAHWELESVETADSSGTRAAIALDGSGYPHISYYHSTDKELKYAYKDADGWHLETVDTVYTQRTSIAIGSDGYARIAYHDNDNENLKYAYRDVGGWNLVTVDSVGDTGPQCSLALDGSDYPHISYKDMSSGYLNYAYEDAGGWTIEAVVRYTYQANDQNRTTRIALGSDGYPRIAFTSETWFVDVKYAYKDGDGWHVENVSLEAGAHAAWLGGMALDDDDYPHLSYFWRTHPATTDYYLKYAYKDAGGWNREIIETGQQYDAYYDTDLVLDEDGLPHISYQNNRVDNLQYAYRDSGGTWHTTTVDDSDSGYSCSITLDDNDLPHIAYAYYTGSSFDLKYARQAPGAYFYIPIYSLSA